MNRFENVGLAAPKDQFLRLVAGPRTSGRRLIAASLFQRLSLDYSDNWSFAGTLVEPICFQGTTGIPMFDLTGSKLITLSGPFWLTPDTVQILDVSISTKGEAVREFHAGGKPAPPWLAKLARVVSGIPVPMWEAGVVPAALSEVFEQAAPTTPNTLYPPYDKIWRHFFLVQEHGDSQQQ
jgi:hypothetical protein